MSNTFSPDQIVVAADFWAQEAFDVAADEGESVDVAFNELCRALGVTSRHDIGRLRTEAFIEATKQEN